ncbi:hypothetical protein Cdeb_01254 [Caldibacillus debilis GB1]|uniref:Uncharacterized protein n=1 Tax=Caldibacillus debilis GB1 TaxID=1339248 RepID=A0A420VDN7_9BACI|nr:hypothetical protein Cdeb_01254 [Caldibacillus debilis GB1]
MYLGLWFVFAITVINLLSVLLVFYYVNRNWSKLIELENHLINISQQIKKDVSNWYENELDSNKLPIRR